MNASGILGEPRAYISVITISESVVRAPVPSRMVTNSHASQPACSRTVLTDIRGAENDPGQVAKVAEFLWLVGFACGGSTLAKNWTGNRLVT
jgi:hypothetical protein